jgi:hypothetical protein
MMMLVWFTMSGAGGGTHEIQVHVTELFMCVERHTGDTQKHMSERVPART